METKKSNFIRVSGIITIASAVALIVFNSISGNNTDTDIMPFILLMTGIIFLRIKPKKETKQIDPSSTKGRIIIATLSISLLSGIIVMLVTLWPMK